MIYSFRIEQAIRAAAVLHDGQVRKGAAPYPFITHLVAVSYLLADYTGDEDTVIAGLLHDTLEDTDYTADELEADFGANVRAIVEGVTDVTKAERAHFTWMERQERYFSALDLAPNESLLVSAADKIHNMRTMVEEYHERPDLFLKQFGKNTGELIEKYRRLHQVLNERLDNDIMTEFKHVHTLFNDFLLTTQAYQHANIKKNED